MTAPTPPSVTVNGNVITTDQPHELNGYGIKTTIALMAFIVRQTTPTTFVLPEGTSIELIGPSKQDGPTNYGTYFIKLPSGRTIYMTISYDLLRDDVGEVTPQYYFSFRREGWDDELFFLYQLQETIDVFPADEHYYWALESFQRCRDMLLHRIITGKDLPA